MRRLFAVAVVGVLLLAGCGDDDETTETGGESTGTTAMGDMPGMSEEDHAKMGDAKCEPSGTALSIVASDTKFDKDCLAAPANQEVTISYENKDSRGHNLVVLKSHTSSDVIARADIFTGPDTVTLDVPAQPAGTYAFHCEVHPQAMMGTFVVK
ncbi:MAG TPA: cupredoxin domain-containing protein [Acidimicrobiales bacterium]|nr:cupredoxin domain-containing protein [Acidimicrobiales bacterium]